MQNRVRKKDSKKISGTLLEVSNQMKKDFFSVIESSGALDFFLFKLENISKLKKIKSK